MMEHYNNIVNMDMSTIQNGGVGDSDATNNCSADMQIPTTNTGGELNVAGDFGAKIHNTTTTSVNETTTTVEQLTSTETLKQLTITLATTVTEQLEPTTTSAELPAQIVEELDILKTVDLLADNVLEDELYEEEEVEASTSTSAITEEATSQEFGEINALDLDYTNSNDSDISNLSDMSDISGRDWKPACSQPLRWIQKQMRIGTNPRELLSQLLPHGTYDFTHNMSDMTIWRVINSVLSEPPRRQKLRHINTFDHVVDLVERSQHIIVLTGAGVSVSCGIPDFRSSDGIYARLAKDFPDLPDPQSMFEINYFQRDPRPFYKIARDIYPGQFRPSPCHRFIKRLEEKQKLLRNYTQNIDTLERVAGINNIIECHGSFSTATCTKCKYKCTADDIRDDIFAQRIPVCPRCNPNSQHSLHVDDPVVCEAFLRSFVENGIMKPDIVFFNEGLPDEFHTVMAMDKSKCDLLIVIGSSLKVRPVALIPSSLPPHVPQILINREQLHHLAFDVQLLGDADVIINQLCHRLGTEYTDICYSDQVLSETTELESCEGLLASSANATNAITTDMPIDFDDAVEAEVDENVQQLDIDSQSVKSNSSADIALRSAYSDSGFESSTSSHNTNLIDTLATTNQAQPEQEQSKLETTVDRDNNVQTKEVERTLSTSSTTTTTTPLQLENSTTTINNTIKTATMRESPTALVNNMVKSCPKTIVRKHQKKMAFRNTAECLIDGTYYCNRKKAAYVFPGAQIHWCASPSSSSSSAGSSSSSSSSGWTSSEDEIEEVIEKNLQSASCSELILDDDIETAISSNQQAATVVAEKRKSTDEQETSDSRYIDLPPVKKMRDNDAQAAETSNSNSVDGGGGILCSENQKQQFLTEDLLTNDDNYCSSSNKNNKDSSNSSSNITI